MPESENTFKSRFKKAKKQDYIGWQSLVSVGVMLIGAVLSGFWWVSDVDSFKISSIKETDILALINYIGQSLWTPTVFIALFGPIIISINFRLLSGFNREKKVDDYSSLFRTYYKQLYAISDHNNQMNALVIAWGTFTFQILQQPISVLNSLNLQVQLYYQQKCGESIDSGCMDFGTKCSGYDMIMNIVKTDAVSSAFVIGVIALSLWMLVKLFLGKLSDIEVVRLYERKPEKKTAIPPMASNLTLYRIIIIIFTTVHVIWMEQYLRLQVVDSYANKCSQFQICRKDFIDSELKIPSDEIFMKFIFFVGFSLLTIYVTRYFYHVIKIYGDSSYIDPVEDLEKSDTIANQ